MKHKHSTSLFAIAGTGKVISGSLLTAMICLASHSELKAQTVSPAAVARTASANVVQKTSAQSTGRNGKVQPVSQQMLGPTGLGYPHVERPRTVRDFSWIYIEEPELEEIKQHDIITILVDKKYQDRVNSNFNRTRTSSFKAELKEFLRISEDGNLTNAAENQPTIDTNLQGKLNSAGATSNQEGIQYRIAAIVVEVLPNGNLVLEARDRIEINGDVFVYTLTGILPSDKVAANMTATSENIYNLDVSKDMKGKVSDSVKRPWGVWLYDKFSPF